MRVRCSLQIRSAHPAVTAGKREEEKGAVGSYLVEQAQVEAAAEHPPHHAAVAA